MSPEPDEQRLSDIEARLTLQRDASPDDQPSRAELREDVAYLLARVKESNAWRTRNRADAADSPRGSAVSEPDA